jgi:hypothetical protein
MDFYSLDSCCTSYNFLGSTRTYVYLATAFSGLNKRIVTPQTVGSENRCIGTSSYMYGGFLRSPSYPSFINMVKIDNKKIGDYEYSSKLPPNLGTQDKMEAIYENIWLSKMAGHSLGGVVAWRDNGIINGIASPLFIAGWFTCFGAPCYPCKFVDNLVCKGKDGGALESFMNDLGDLSDKYWEKNEYVPWDGFIQDWYGIIWRKAEPATGWMIYLLFMGQYCAPCGYYDEYCGCCVFCILKNCVEPMFTARIYGGSILLLNYKRGIPFLKADKLEDFQKKLEQQYDYGKMNIKLNHLADEYIFFQGQVGWTNGDISLYKVNRPGSGISGSSSDNNEATIISGGSGTFIKLLTGDDIPVISRTGSQGFLLSDMSVGYKNEINFSGELSYPWIYVDIPSPLSIEKSYVAFSFDNGTLPPMVYGEGIPWNPWSPSYYWTQQRKLMVRTDRVDGGFRTYTQVPLPRSSDSPPPDQTLTYYYKRYVKKIVKAPYHLYIKSGETTFRTCKLGETLKNLTPGRYYFPNPAYVNRQLGGFDPDFEDLKKLELVDESENFSDYFNTYYRQFNVTMEYYPTILEFETAIENAKNNPTVKFFNAVALIGPPEQGAASVEYGGAFEYNKEDFDAQKLSNLLQNSANVSTAIENFFSIPR